MKYYTYLLLILLISLTTNCSTSKELKGTKPCNYGIFQSTMNDAKVNMVGDNIIVSCASYRDFFNSPWYDRSNAPLLLKLIDNKKPFTFVTKVKPKFNETYDAGVVYIYSNKNLWHKFAFEKDERGLTRMVNVRTVGTSDDNNNDVVCKEDVYIKISSDTHQVGFYYSLDGVKWQMVKLYMNNYPKKIYIALSSQSPMGKGNETHFSNIKLTNESIKNFRLGE